MIATIKHFLIEGESVKGFFTLTVSALLASFYAVETAIILYVILFAFDVLFGIVEDKLKNRKGFCIKKFGRALALLGIYVVINFLISAICHMNKDAQAGETALKIITYACAYFYAVNITKNLTGAFPEVRFFAFLYYLLSFEAIKFIPGMQKFNEKKSEP